MLHPANGRLLLNFSYQASRGTWRHKGLHPYPTQPALPACKQKCPHGYPILKRDLFSPNVFSHG